MSPSSQAPSPPTPTSSIPPSRSASTPSPSPSSPPPWTPSSTPRSPPPTPAPAASPSSTSRPPDALRGPRVGLRRIAEATLEHSTEIIQHVYSQPIRDDLVGRRVEEIRARGGVAAVSATPQNTEAPRAHRQGRRRELLRRPVDRHHRPPRLALAARPPARRAGRAARPRAGARRQHGRHRRGDRADGDGRARHPRRRGAGRGVHVARGARHRHPAGDGDARHGVRARPVLRAHGPLRADHHRRRHPHRRRLVEVDLRGRRRRHGRLPLRGDEGGAGPRLPLGHGDAARGAAARRARPRRPAAHARHAAVRPDLAHRRHREPGRRLRTAMATCGALTIADFHAARMVIAPRSRRRGRSTSWPSRCRGRRTARLLYSLRSTAEAVRL